MTTYTTMWMGLDVRLLLLLVSLHALLVHSEPVYTVIAPQVVRPDSQYHVAVSTYGTREECYFTISIDGTVSGGRTSSTSKSAVVAPETSQVIRFELGSQQPGDYNLTTKVEGGIKAQNQSMLKFEQKSKSVFVQTDKAIYKPGQLVQFRVIVVNPQLKPRAVGAFNVYMMDAKNNRVKQWKRVTLSKGVFSGELQLSEQPVLGEWTIVVEFQDSEGFKKVFEVAEYVLPKFEVSVDLPPYVTYKDDKIRATFIAKYTYGKPVKGKATIEATPEFHYAFLQPEYHDPVRRTVKIDGSVTESFSIKDDLKLSHDNEHSRKVRFTVVVEEELTGRRQNASATISVHKSPYKLELLQAAENFKPGLKYTAYMKVATQDDVPVQDGENQVTVRHGYSYSDKPFENKYFIPSNGIIQLDFYPPADETINVLEIEAEYKGHVEWFPPANRAQSPSNTFIQGILKTKNPQVGTDIMIEVNSTVPLSQYTYQVVGRGDIVMSRSMAGFDMHSHQFSFLATQSMAPRCRVVISVILEDGEVVADGLEFDVDGAFQNFVSIEANPKEGQPGKNVEISVKSKPSSQVYVLGIDQSVVLLKSGNDVTQADVLEELQSYDAGKKPNFFPWGCPVFRKKRSLIWYPGSSTAQEVFDNTGVVIQTNGFVYHMNPYGIYFRTASVEPNISSGLQPRTMSSNVLSKTQEVLAADASSGSLTYHPSPIDTRIRTDFFESWLFNDTRIGFDGNGKIQTKAPDTITSWVITGFSMSDAHGMGVIPRPEKFKVFRPFFVSLNLPYSVIRGEVIAIQAIVFNYMSKDLSVDVTLENMGDFEFTSFENEINSNEVQSLELFKKKNIVVKSGDGASVSFMITPQKLGYIDIKVTARSTSAGDAVKRSLLVEAEGETQYRNKAVFADLRTTNDFDDKVTIDIPSNAVPDSQFITVSAIGDVLGSTINNLDNLIRMPYGCGEQNMLNFVPNIVVVDYLEHTNQLTDRIAAKAKKFMEAGYQRELTYKRDDHSFSAFGNSDESGSTWLTAFVARSFHQAKPFIDVEDSIIKNALDWIVSNQEEDGSFPEVGKVSHKDMQGGSGKGLALTAYTLLALLENKEQVQLSNAQNKAINFLARELGDTDDPYILAIVTYALHLANHPNKERAFSILSTLATVEGDMMYWQKPVPEEDKKNPWYGQPRSVNVEMTSYVLLTYLERGMAADALPIMRWLISQQNENGGFASTQDTVIGLYSLAKLAQKLGASRTDLDIRFSYDGGHNTMEVNIENKMILQKYQLPSDVREVDIQVKGRGFAVLQVSYMYNLNVSGAYPLFNVDPQLDKNADENHLQLSVCTDFPGKEDSNMAVMEVNLPSGYTANPDGFPSLRKFQDVKRVETKNGDTTVVVYFDKLTNNPVCPTFSAYRTFDVAKQKPVPVVVYDYYDSSRRARQFYEPIVATLCDICDVDECDSSCGDKGRFRGGGNNGASDGRSTIPMLLLYLLAATLSAILLI